MRFISWPSLVAGAMSQFTPPQLTHDLLHHTASYCIKTTSDLDPSTTSDLNSSTASDIWLGLGPHQHFALCFALVHFRIRLDIMQMQSDVVSLPSDAVNRVTRNSPQPRYVHNLAT